MKVIPKTNFKNKDSKKKIEKEVAILKLVSRNPFVVQLYEVFEDINNVYLISEYVDNGDLVQYFKKEPLFEEH